MPLSGFRIKSEYHLSEDSNSSASPKMVETTTPLIRNRADSPSLKMSPQTQNFLNSKILISPQNISYFEQRLQKTSLSDQKKSDNYNNSAKHLNGNTPSSSSSSSSLFTIDSILAKQTRYSESPSSSPTHEDNVFIKNGTYQSSPNRSSNRSMSSNAAAALFQHHPGLHITHLAASNFGSPEFLGKFLN
jgi:hypothetical protein